MGNEVKDQLINIMSQKIAKDRFSVEDITDQGKVYSFSIQFSQFVFTTTVPSCISVIALNFKRKILYCHIEKSFLL